MRGVVAAVFQGTRPCSGRSVTKLRATRISDSGRLPTSLRESHCSCASSLWFVPEPASRRVFSGIPRPLRAATVINRHRTISKHHVRPLGTPHTPPPTCGKPRPSARRPPLTPQKQTRPERPGLDPLAMLQEVVRLRRVPPRDGRPPAAAELRDGLYLQEVPEGLPQGCARV